MLTVYFKLKTIFSLRMYFFILKPSKEAPSAAKQRRRSDCELPEKAIAPPGTRAHRSQKESRRNRVDGDVAPPTYLRGGGLKRSYKKNRSR